MPIRKTLLAAFLSTVSVSTLCITALPAAANVQASIDNSYVRSAKTHFDAGRFREASIELKNALRQDPDNGMGRYLLGRILLQQGDINGAMKELGRAHKLSPNDDTSIWLAEARMKAGDPKGALELLQGDGTTIDGTVQRLTLSANAFTQLSRFDEAEAAYLRTLEVDPRRVEGHFGLAKVYAAREDYKAAADKLDEIVIGKPDFAPGWMLRGEVSMAKGDRQAAFVAFDRAVSLAPEAPAPLIARARANLATGNLDRATADRDAVRTLAPDAPITYYLNAAIEFAEGDFEAANRSFTQLQRNFDSFAPAVLLGALIKHKKGEHNQADSLLTRYITMQPGNLEARRALASVRLANGQPRNALEMLNSVLSKSPNDMASLRQQASAYLSLDQYDKAEAIFKRVAQSRVPAEAREAEMALTLLNPPQTIQDPGFTDVNTRRLLLKAVDRLSNDDHAAAQNLLDRVKVRGSATVLALRGTVAMELGNTKEARGYLDQSLQIVPDMMSAIATYAQLDQRDGTPENILPRLKQLLKSQPKSEVLTLGVAQRMSEEGKRQEATAFLAERSKVAPRSLAISRALVSAHMVQEDFDAAADEAVRLAGIASDNPAILVFVTNALMDANAADRAVPVAEKISSLVPESPRSATLLAETQMQSGAVDAARNTLKAAIRKWPDVIPVTATLVRLEVLEENVAAVKSITKALARKHPSTAARLTANAMTELGKPAEAVKALESAYAKKPNSPLAIDLFKARRLANQDEIAFKDMSAWVEANKTDRAALLTYATALMEMDRKGEAAKAYEAYLVLEPNNPVALNNYAWLRHQNQRPDALDYAQRAYDAASGSPEIADTYGWMLVTYGKVKEGLALLQTAKDAAPNNPGIHYHFAYALSKSGRKDEAKAVLVNVLQGTASFDERAEAEQLMNTLNDG